MSLSENNLDNVSREIARGLLSIKAVFLSPDKPFTWASGIKSPIYCDNRLTLTAPEIRGKLEEGLSSLIRENFPECQVLMGTATAGIAHAAIVGHILNMPMGYVRSSAKDHGRTNRIEGSLLPGEKVVVIEDLISTAGSSCEAVEAIRDAQGDVLGIVSIFSYGMKKAEDTLSSHKVKNVSLCTLDILLDEAVKENYISESQKAQILKFRDNPSDERWMKGDK